jgi:hypothetical protein
MKTPLWLALSIGVLNAPAIANTGQLSGDAHTVRLNHRGGTIDVTYAAKVKVHRKQIGMSPPTRLSTARCIWAAEVDVERRMPGVAAARTISSDKAIKGSRAGDCASNRKAIDEEVASRGDEVRTHLAAVADRDRRQLTAELDATEALATRD